MKKLAAVLMAVLALTCLLAVPAFSADKLIVKDTGGSNTVFAVRDGGPPAPGYIVDVTSDSVMKSSLHFSVDGSDNGGYITSVLPNNFFLSSGAAYDQTAGGWVAKTSSAVIAGSGNAGYRIFLADTCTPGSVCTALNTPKVVVDYAGNLSATSFNQTSSREYKDNIQKLDSDVAAGALMKLDPVTFNYKADPGDNHVGFIAEDVPDLVATRDRQHLSAMDIVAVLTKVVQEQNKTITELSNKLKKLETHVARIESKNMFGSIKPSLTSCDR